MTDRTPLAQEKSLAPQGGVDKRRSPRHPFVSPVLVEAPSGRMVELQGVDISYFGLGMSGRVDEVLPEHVRLQITFQGRGTMKTSARIVWRGGAKYGLEFGPEATAPGSPLPDYIASLGWHPPEPESWVPSV